MAKYLILVPKAKYNHMDIQRGYRQQSYYFARYR